jgi:hypothetical protein
VKLGFTPRVRTSGTPLSLLPKATNWFLFLITQCPKNCSFKISAINPLSFNEKKAAMSTSLFNPNPPSRVLYSSDYRLQRAAMGFHSTLSPDGGCGFDQNDRADINPQPRVGRSLSPQPISPHGSPSPVFQVHLNPVILVKNRNPSATHNSFIPMKPTRLSLHESEQTTGRKNHPWPTS